jgi:hypothetical protein
MGVTRADFGSKPAIAFTPVRRPSLGNDTHG